VSQRSEPPAARDMPPPVGEHRLGPRSDESVMALIMRPPTGEQPQIGENLDVALLAPHVTSNAPPLVPEAPAFIEPSRHAATEPSRARVKDTLSATASLFVQGLDILDDPELDRVPKTIKPTVLGWLLILVIFASSLAFAWYKRSKVHEPSMDDQALLSLGDIKPGEEADASDQPAKGSIRLEATPTEAMVLLHVGDTPVDVEQLDMAHAHLLRIERDGYAAMDRLVQPEQIAAGSPISVALHPTGAGSKASLPSQIPSGEPSGRVGTLNVTSDPPSASVWRVLGRGSVHLPDIPAKRYYFKVMHDGYQTAFVSVSPAQFKNNDGAVTETVRLKPDAATDQAALTSGSPPEPTLDEPPPKTKRRARRTKRSSKRRRSRRHSRRRKSRKSRKAGKSLQLPSWAD
jgi:hypothetical protein